MDRRNMIWPTTGPGERLATLLRDAATAGTNGLSGQGDTIIVNYLEWVGSQVRMLQGVLTPHDLDRLLTTPRYWATLDNPIPTSTIVSAVMDEVQHRVRLLRAAADAVDGEVRAWRPQGKHTDFVVPDTNFWVNVRDDLGTLDWHRLLEGADGRSYPSGEEIRIVVPMLVIDELDGLSHKGDKRDKVSGVNKYLYGLLGDDPGITQTVRPGTGGHGDVTMQLLFEPLGHTRLPNSDDELVERVVVLRDFMALAARRVFFLTYDGGAAFRSTNAGLMTRHVATRPRRPNGG